MDKLDMFSRLDCDWMLEKVLQMVNRSQKDEEKMQVYDQLEAADIKIQKHIKAMTAFKEKYTEQIGDIDEARKKFDECLSEVDDVEGVLKEKLEDARGKANESDNDEDVLEGVTVYKNKDPFTKKKIDNPVKSRVCNHVFDEESAREMLEKGGRFKCPVVGCTKTIKEEDLEEFPQFFVLCDR